MSLLEEADTCTDEMIPTVCMAQRKGSHSDGGPASSRAAGPPQGGRDLRGCEHAAPTVLPGHAAELGGQVQCGLEGGWSALGL